MAEPVEQDLADPPVEAGALARFPVRALRAGTGVHRLHHDNLGPWWFGSAPIDAPRGGRFDLAPPGGSSNWALSGVAAFLETLARRPARVVPLELVDRFHLSTGTVPSPIEAANAPVRRSWGFGLTGELHTTTGFRITRRWANALHAAGFHALLAIPRHDVTARLRSLTFFGRAGEQPGSGAAGRSAPARCRPHSSTRWPPGASGASRSRSRSR